MLGSVLRREISRGWRLLDFSIFSLIFNGRTDERVGWSENGSVFSTDVRNPKIIIKKNMAIRGLTTLTILFTKFDLSFSPPIGDELRKSLLSHT